jgi:hypothetical protein
VPGPATEHLQGLIADSFYFTHLCTLRVPRLDFQAS